MTQAQPLVVQTPGVTYEASDFRGIFDQLFTEGVRDVAAGQLAVTALTDGTLRVAVATGTAYVKGDDVPATQGLYILRCTAAENVSVSAPPSSGSRLDLLVWEEIDQDVVALAGRPAGSRFRAVPGTAVTTGSPVLPTLPPTAIPLASFPVAAGQTTIPAASIVDMRTQAGAASVQIGTQAFPRTTAQRDAIASPFDGQLIYNTDTGALEAGDATSKLFGSTRGLGTLFGDGSDGDVTVTGTVTLVRDMQYRNLTVVSGATLNTNGFRIAVQGILRNSGTIANNGTAGGDGTFLTNSYTTTVNPNGPGGGATASHRLGNGASGGSGGFYAYDFSSGGNNYQQATAGGVGQYGGAGGRGGATTGQGVGGTFAGGSVSTVPTTAVPPVLSTPFDLLGLLGLVIVSGGLISAYAGGAGGGAGGVANTNAGGGVTNTHRSGAGGGGGGVLVIVAETLINDGLITAGGGKGGNGAGTNAAPGGGGGGGIVVTFTRRRRGTGSITAPGGAAGTTGNHFAAVAGTAGNVYTIGV